MFSGLSMIIGLRAVRPRPTYEQGKAGWPSPIFKWQFIWLMVFWVTQSTYYIYSDSYWENGVLVSRLALVASLVSIVCVTVQSWWHWLYRVKQDSAGTV